MDELTKLRTELLATQRQLDALEDEIRTLLDDHGDWVCDPIDKTYHFVMRLTAAHVHELQQLVKAE
jgi:fructose-1,6-bisphosphatase/inositol monophosphatase family enzyme